MRTTSLLALTLGFLLAACASTTLKPSAEARNSLAPTGKLRVGLILSNPVLVTKDPGTGELRGVTVDLGRSLAASLGAQFEPISYTNPAALTQSFGKNEWDIAFIGLDPTRAAVVDFSQPYMEVENSYLVPANSRIRTIADADQPGIRIA